MSTVLPGRVRPAMPVRSAATVAVVTAAAAGLVTGPAPMRVPAGLLLALVLPGTALTAALFSRRVLTTVERVVLAPALSLALVVVSGLVLNAIGVGLDRGSWSAATAGVTVLALAAAVLSARAAGGPAAELGSAPERAPEREPGPPEPGPRGGSRRPPARQVAPLVLAAVLLVGAGWFSFANARDDATRTVTAMSVTRQNPATTAGRRVVEIAVTGLVPADAPYRLVATGSDGTLIVTRRIAAGHPSSTVYLDLAMDDRVTVALHRAREPGAVYRSVTLGPAT